MNKKYPNVRIALLLACTAMAGATSGSRDNVVIHMSNGGSPFKAALRQTTRISFQGSSMVINEAGGPAVTIPVRDIERMTFDLATSSAEELDSPLTDDLTFTVEREKVKLVSASGGDIEMHVFDAAGHHVGAISSTGEAEFDFTDMNPGIYVIATAGKSIKYLNK